MHLYPLYEKAKELLYHEYEYAFDIVKESDYHRAFVNEKIRHSLQVSGAGNGILAHEKYFLNQPNDFIDICKTSILLHDIYRFREILGSFENGIKIDHSLKGAEFLEKTTDFNNIFITLPIKHHGHMIEKMYEDEAYKNLDIQTQDIIKHIAFAVRDADKIANWYLLTNEFDDIKDVWLPYPDDFSAEQAKINDELWAYFTNDTVAPNTLRQTNADCLMSIICWLFDMNYSYSIFYCQKLKCFDGFYKLLRKFNVSKDKIDTVSIVIKRFVFQKFHIVL